MITKEKLEHHIKHLKQKHKALHNIVEALEAENAPYAIITNRKKEKLALKDEINSLKKRANSM